MTDPTEKEAVTVWGTLDNAGLTIYHVQEPVFPRRIRIGRSLIHRSMADEYPPPWLQAEEGGRRVALNFANGNAVYRGDFNDLERTWIGDLVYGRVDPPKEEG